MVTKELVLDLGVEGGGASIYRILLVSGGYQYHTEGSSMFLDDNDEEGWRSWTTEPVGNVQAALHSICPDGSWINFCPITVHRDYRSTIWLEVEKNLSARMNAPGRSRQQTFHQWKQACSLEQH